MRRRTEMFKINIFLRLIFQSVCMVHTFLRCPRGWNGGAQLKGTIYWIYFIMNKAFVWGAPMLNRGPESRARFELSGQRHHRIHAPFHIHLVPQTGGPSHLSFWLSSVSSKSAYNHRSSAGFYVQKNKPSFSALYVEEEEKAWNCDCFHLLAGLPGKVKCNWNCTFNKIYMYWK